MKKNKLKAIALRYDGDAAPRITAKGDGAMAKRILAKAKEHHIPIEQNEELISLLAQVKLNEEIPRSLYIVVAQLLAFLYYLNGKTPDKKG